jgi:hypothetical protein
MGWSARLFRLGRGLALDGAHDGASLDWDHTLSNFQIFEDLSGLLATRWRSRPPPERLADAPMTAIEIARPFMTEFCFGLMAGFALRQGVRRLGDWHAYVPRVFIATHTWPDRVGLMGAHFMPILALGEGLMPGAPDTYPRLTGPSGRSVVHLHHFVDYAFSLIARCGKGGASALTPLQADELATLLADGRAHHRKPLGAWSSRGIDPRRLLIIDDSSRVIDDAARQARLGGFDGLRAVRVPHSYAGAFRDVQEWHKVYPPALWSTRGRAMAGSARRIARHEAVNSPVPALLRAFEGARAAREFGARLPAGVLLPVHETPTTLGKFWHSYVEPIGRVRAALRRVVAQAGRVRGGDLA